LPTVNNANYIWINLFYAALNDKGRAGFVMANSASDAGGTERELRKKLIETGTVDCILAVGPNMFFTVTLPVTLWFLDTGKARGSRGDKVLFIDARHVYRQMTRAHRTFDPDHIEFLGNIVRLWRSEKVELTQAAVRAWPKPFPMASTGTWPGSARLPLAARSKRKSGASIPAVMARLAVRATVRAARLPPKTETFRRRTGLARRRLTGTTPEKSAPSIFARAP
jgi:type I restriction enzyme M protein